MARLSCQCGYSMWNGNVPNDIEFYVYSDQQMCSIQEEDTVSTLLLPQRKDYEVWRCPECKRLYVFKKGSNQVRFIYKLEKE